MERWNRCEAISDPEINRQTLRDSRWLECIPDELKARWAKDSYLIQVPANTNFLVAGEVRRNEIYLVRSGCVEVIRYPAEQEPPTTFEGAAGLPGDNGFRLLKYRKGDLFGVMEHFIRHPTYIGTIEVVSDASILVVPDAAFSKLIDFLREPANGKLAVDLLVQMAYLMVAEGNKMATFSLSPAKRLAQYLSAEYKARVKEMTDDEYITPSAIRCVLLPKIDQSHISQSIGYNRTGVNTLLSLFDKEKVIRMQDTRIWIVDAVKLDMIVRGELLSSAK